MHSLLISTITNMLENAEIIVLGIALFVYIVAIGVLIALGRSIAEVNELIKRASAQKKEKDKTEDEVVLVNNYIVNEEKENIDTSEIEGIEPIHTENEGIEQIDNNKLVIEEDTELEDTTDYLDDDIIDDEDSLIEENENDEDNITAFTESIEDIILDDSEVSNTDEAFININTSNSIDSEVINDTDELIEDINEVDEPLNLLDNTVEPFIEPTVDEMCDEEAPISLAKNERRPVFIQPNAEALFDEPIPNVSYETATEPKFIQSGKVDYDAPESLDKTQRDNELPIFSESSFIDETAPAAFEEPNKIPKFNYSSQNLDSAPEKLEEVRAKELKVKNENIIPEFSRPIGTTNIDRPDKLIHSEIEKLSPAEFIKSEYSDSVEPPKFDSEYPEDNIEPPEFNYFASLLDDIPQSFEEIAKDTIPETVDSEEPVFVAPIKPPPKGLYEEMPDNSLKEEIEIEKPETVIPEGLTEEEKKLIAEQQALLDQLNEESLSEDAENYDIVGICTDTSAFTAFENKLHNATNRIKYYYSELKNTLQSYKGVKSKLTNAGDSFRVSGSIVARITFNGNKLRLHLSLDPNEYNKSIYNHYSLADVKAYKEIPLALEIAKRADLSTASKLIQDAMGSKFVLYIDQKREYVDYAAYYTDKEE